MNLDGKLKGLIYKAVQEHQRVQAEVASDELETEEAIIKENKIRADVVVAVKKLINESKATFQVDLALRLQVEFMDNKDIVEITKFVSNFE